jgi:hypothetical protein
MSYVGADDYTDVYSKRFGTHHVDWREFREEWINTSNCLGHFFCHNDSGSLTSRNDAFSLNWILIEAVASQRTKRQKGPDLLFLNACDTQDLVNDDNWRRILESEPFNGYIGTQAAVHPVAAQEFARAFFGFLAIGADVHDAFDRARHKTWPASLYYGMYLHPQLASRMSLAATAE